MTGVPDRPSSARSVPAFADVASHDDLVAWSRAYTARAVESTDLAVDPDRVDWDVSTRAKRRAAAVLHPRIENAALGAPIDWERRDLAGFDLSTANPGDERLADSREPVPPVCTIRLTWGAATAYDRQTWAQTLRHELVHVEQFQRFGTTGHGPAFEARATDLETTVRCQRFATPRYVLTCPACETVVARRYRDCKLVRRHESYRSTCCDASLSLTRTGSPD